MTPATEAASTPRTGDNSRVFGRTAEGLLDSGQLLSAVAGCRVQGRSPMIGWARELADLHATLLTTAVSVAWRTAVLDDIATRDRVTAVVALIDEWAVLHLPRPVDTMRHTHSLGEVISHFAQIYARCQSTLRHTSSAEHQHEAALRMAQTLEGYADLVAAIRELRVRLPVGWRGVRASR